LAPQLAQVGVAAGGCVGAGAEESVAGVVGAAAGGGWAGAAWPNAAPQLSQKDSPGVNAAPQTEQLAASAVGAGCAVAGAGGAAAGGILASFAPHSSQKAAPSGCCEPQFGHAGMVFLL